MRRLLNITENPIDFKFSFILNKGKLSINDLKGDI